MLGQTQREKSTRRWKWKSSKKWEKETPRPQRIRRSRREKSSKKWRKEETAESIEKTEVSREEEDPRRGEGVKEAWGEGKSEEAKDKDFEAKAASFEEHEKATEEEESEESKEEDFDHK